jgi:hypothetical protein
MPIFTDEDIKILYTKQHRIGGSEAIVYDDNNYLELLNKTKLTTWDDDDQVIERDQVPTKAVRVSLSINFLIKIGKEGPPNLTTMAHEKLTGGKSLAPGQFFFNENHQLCALSNKSSDYEPDFATLQFLVVKLILDNKIPFAKEITFKKYSRDPITRSIKEEIIKISFEDLLKEVSTLKFYQNFTTIINQPLDSSAAVSSSSTPLSPLSIITQSQRAKRHRTPDSARNLAAPETGFNLAQKQTSDKRRIPFSLGELSNIPVSSGDLPHIPAPPPVLQLFGITKSAVPTFPVFKTNGGCDYPIQDLFTHTYLLTTPTTPPVSSLLFSHVSADEKEDSKTEKELSFFKKYRPSPPGFPGSSSSAPSTKPVHSPRRK